MTEISDNDEPHPTGEDASVPLWRMHYPFDSHWLGVDGAQMHYVDEWSPRPELRNQNSGEASETLLFVHGNPTWSFHWRRLIGRFRQSHRCVAPDHLGCGLSDKPTRTYALADRVEHLVHLVDDLRLRRVTLVAQDWGGAIGLGAMIQRPEHLQRIVLFNTGAFPPWYIPWQIRLCRIPLLGRWAVQGGNLFSRAALRMTMASRRLDDDVAAGYLAPYDRWAHRRAVYDFVQDIPRSGRHQTWATLAHIESQLSSLQHRPILLCWGLRDWCFRPDCLHRFKEIWPHARVESIDDAGHWIVEDAPDEVAALMSDFLGCSTGRPAAEARGASATV